MALLGALIGGAVSAFGASRAAKSQERAADQMAETQRYVFDESVALTEPQRRMGQNALSALAYEFGIGERPTVRDFQIEEGQRTIPGAGRVRRPAAPNDFNRYQPSVVTDRQQNLFTVGDREFSSRADAQDWIDQQPGFEYQGYQQSPGYQFRMQQGRDALEGSAANRGNLFSGATGQALTQFGQDYATNDYNRYIGGLNTLAGFGQSATGQNLNALQSYGQGMTNAYGASGNAQAAGAIGVSNAITGSIDNYLGYQQFNRLLGGGPSGGSGGGGMASSLRPLARPF